MQSIFYLLCLLKLFKRVMLWNYLLINYKVGNNFPNTSVECIWV